MKTIEALRALAALARHLAENIVTNPELAEKLLAHADELDEDARRLEGIAKADRSAQGTI
jgi:hypothetical protein